jgi:hypothetical protein
MMQQIRLVQFLLFGFSLTLSGFSAASSHAALPDQETYDFVTRRYNLLLEETRSGCGYYANPSTLSVTGDERALSVLLMRGPSGGSSCNGLFQFQRLQVRCSTEEVSYSEQIGSPANWEISWYQNNQVAQQICSLPSSTESQ